MRRPAGSRPITEGKLMAMKRKGGRAARKRNPQVQHPPQRKIGRDA